MTPTGGGEHGDEMTFGDRPLNVDSRRSFKRRKCAKSGHSQTTWQQAGLDPKHAFKIGLLDGREGLESGHWRYE